MNVGGGLHDRFPDPPKVQNERLAKIREAVFWILIVFGFWMAAMTMATPTFLLLTHLTVFAAGIWIGWWARDSGRTYW